MSGREDTQHPEQVTESVLAEMPVVTTSSSAAYERLQRLYEVSTCLVRFESVERSVPHVIDTVAQTLSLRSVIFLLESGTPGKPSSIVWQGAGEDALQLQGARANAQRSYGYLMHSDVELEGVLESDAAEPDAGFLAQRRYMLLPLIAAPRRVFGALHVAGFGAFDELDLMFVSAVANQLAIAVDRQADIDVRQAVSSQALAVSERNEATAQARRADAELKRDAAIEAEEIVRAQFAFANDVTTNLGEGVIAVDRAGSITLFNPAAEALCGCTVSSVMGKPLEDVVRWQTSDGRSLQAAQHPVAVAMQSNMRVRGEDALASSDARDPFPVSYSCSPLRRDDQVTGAVLAFRDILELKLAERQQRALAELSALIGSSLDMQQTLTALAHFAVPLLGDLCVLDEQRSDGSVHRVAVKFADESKQRDLSGKVMQFAPRPGWQSPPAKVLESGRSILLREIQDYEALTATHEHCAVMRATGVRSMLVVALRARGRTLGALTLGYDESHRRYGASDVLLAEEIAERAALAVDNARLYEEAQRATRSRDDLLAIVSHDLKSPLGVILTGVELMDTYQGEEAPARRPIEIIRRAVARMDRLIADLLDTASIDAGKLSLERRRLTSVTAFVEETIDGFQPLAQAKSLKLTTQLQTDLPAIIADTGRLQQVFSNLVGNAIKFTPQGGMITVRAATDGDFIEFRVIDSGPGIPAHELPRIFERFWRAHRTARMGTGLGLAIAQGIITAHGGTIRVESRFGAGTSLIFTLPWASPIPHPPLAFP